MPWCPKCKAEYRAGIEKCADCKVDLVDELPAETEEIVTPEMMYVDASDFEVGEDDGEIQDEDLKVAPKRKRDDVKVYQNKKAKAEDFKSSAYTLVIVGVLGLLALILIELQILPVRLAAPGKYITYLVMGGLFVIFIISGISSFKSSKKYAQEALEEDDLTTKIKTWALENITKDIICEKAHVTSDMPEEMKYFHYFEVLKMMIRAEFGDDVNASYLESLCEELYGTIFEEN